MSGGCDAIATGGGSPGCCRAEARAKGGQPAALVKRELVGGERAALKAFHGQITTARGPGAFGARVACAGSRTSAATSIGLQKGTQPEREAR